MRASQTCAQSPPLAARSGAHVVCSCGRRLGPATQQRVGFHLRLACVGPGNALLGQMREAYSSPIAALLKSIVPALALTPPPGPLPHTHMPHCHSRATAHLQATAVGSSERASARPSSCLRLLHAPLATFAASFAPLAALLLALALLGLALLGLGARVLIVGANNSCPWVLPGISAARRKGG